MSVTYYIRGGGDASVGIADESATVTFDSEWLGDEKECDRVRRETLAEMFANLFDGKVTVWREDDLE